MKKEFENSGYFVDTQGNIYGKNGKILKTQRNEKGYETIHLQNKNISLSTSVHRLVARVFIPNPENKPEVNHINGIRDDNRVENLEWVTSKENKRHAMEKLGNGYGQTHSQAQITEEQVRAVCDMIMDNYRSVDIAKKLDIYIEKVRSIRKKQSWQHITNDYEFPKQNSDHGISDTTFIWLCHMMQEGHRLAEINKRYVGNEKLTHQLLYAIRKGLLRPHMSKGFNFSK